MIHISKYKTKIYKFTKLLSKNPSFLKINRTNRIMLLCRTLKTQYNL